MRGSLRPRGPGSWQLVLEFGYQRDPVTGKTKRVQKYVTVRGTKRDAETKLNDLVGDVQDHAFIERNTRTVGEWLLEWVEKAIKPPMRTPRAYDTYRGVINAHLVPALGHVRLQELKAVDLERYYAEQMADGYATATLEQHHHIVFGALKAAVKAKLVATNVAQDVTGKPRRTDDRGDVREHCWTAEEATAFLLAAKAEGPQPAAFYALALDSGMRKSELCGLKWPDVDFTTSRVLVQRQLLTGGSEPTFTVPKGKRSRVIDIAAETVALLKRHKAHQATLKMRNRRRYHDFGLVFGKEWADLSNRRDTLGEPLQANNLGQREYARLIAAADVRPIKFHGLRHTCATLLIAAGVPAKVVQERLGHKDISTTLDTYAHVLPSMQQDAARRLAALLHGGQSVGKPRARAPKRP